jgi:competence protein ComEA
MSTAPVSGRRWAAICLPIVAVLFLFFVGRRATNAATVPSAPLAPSASAVVAVADAGFADVAPDAPPSEATPDAPRVAIEQLADGGVIVDLNVASESELRKLPGVGPTRARKIVELRTHLGRFKSVDDLARIKGFGRATIRRLRPMTRAS